MSSHDRHQGCLERRRPKLPKIALSIMQLTCQNDETIPLLFNAETDSC